MKKVLVFLSRIFRFFLFKNAPQALPMRCRRSKIAPQAKFLKNIPKNMIFQEKKQLSKIKIVLAHRSQKKYFYIQKSTCTSPLIVGKSEKQYLHMVQVQGGIDRRGILLELLRYYEHQVDTYIMLQSVKSHQI